MVAVAVIVGYEPLKITDDEDRFKVDDTILEMADYIKKRRKEIKAKLKRVK